jgi:hypothetical protein
MKAKKSETAFSLSCPQLNAFHNSIFGILNPSSAQMAGWLDHSGDNVSQVTHSQDPSKGSSNQIIRAKNINGVMK